jgi:hypothetical protein
MASPLTLTIMVAIIGVLLTLVSVLLAYLVDRGRRYNYLADRWNELMHIDIEEWEFFDPHKTSDYKSF